METRWWDGEEMLDFQGKQKIHSGFQTLEILNVLAISEPSVIKLVHIDEVRYVPLAPRCFACIT
jgi:hypothetical protein